MKYSRIRGVRRLCKFLHYMEELLCYLCLSSSTFKRYPISFYVVLAFFQTQLQYLWNGMSRVCVLQFCCCSSSKVFGQREVLERKRCMEYQEKAAALYFFVWWCSIASLFLLMAFLSLSKKREMRQVVIF